MTPTISFQRLRAEEDRDIPLPRYMSAQAAGMDICAAIEEELPLGPGERAIVRTGLAIGLPAGFEAQIRPRSGLAARHGITVINSPGTIDADYRGEILVALINLGREPYTIRRGERIAQMVIQKVWQAQLEEVDQLDRTHRNDGGFGSTGPGGATP